MTARAYRKKLIEVALPLEAINRESAREKSIRHGHPSTLHLWWARRPLAAARAVLFAQLVDDPSAWPEHFPTPMDQDVERKRLFSIIEALVLWDNTNNEDVLADARREIARSHARSQPSKRAHAILGAPSRNEINAYLAEVVPPVFDPFCGGGTIPLEAQRLGLRTVASDLNPVAVMICKALVDIPQRFGGFTPVNPGVQRRRDLDTWKGTQGLAEDVRYYGEWLRTEATRRIGSLYPTSADQKTVIAWLWARTVASPDPAFSDVQVPLVSNFFLATDEGKQTWVEPVITRGSYRFEIRTGIPKESDAIAHGTKLGRGANFRCVMSGVPIDPAYIKQEAVAGRMHARLMAMVVDGEKGRAFLPPDDIAESVAYSAMPSWKPEVEISGSTQYVGVRTYGMEHFWQLFTKRQLVALSTLSELVIEGRELVKRDALTAGMKDDDVGLAREGTGALAYAEALCVYLGFCVDKATLTNTTQATWQKSPTRLTQAFGRQAYQMTWDYAEANPLSEAGGGIGITAHAVAKVLERLPVGVPPGKVEQQDATKVRIDGSVSTDPPYFDNVPYADLSDYFYVWLRRSQRAVFPDLFATVAVPKVPELVAFGYRHAGGKPQAEAFFLEGMTNAMHRVAEQAATAGPVTIYYAFRQTETEDEGTASTGWETFLDAVLRAGFGISGTWPMRTEYTGNLKTKRNALASSVVLVCRPRSLNAPPCTRRDIAAQLRSELPTALAQLHKESIAPVDLAQAAIGPGMAIFSSYAKVLEADGSEMTVRSALQLINEVLDEQLNQMEGELDAESRFALTWYETRAFETGPYGEAETLAKARAVAVDAVAEAGIVKSGGGKVRLLKRPELPDDWDPKRDTRPTAWEATQHLIKRLEEKGEDMAAELLASLGSRAAAARDLAYRLYSTCQRRGWADEARAYNGLVVAWPDLERLARQHQDGGTTTPRRLL